jgi:hypothetical protein
MPSGMVHARQALTIQTSRRQMHDPLAQTS